jgi:uncharacterized membrane protein
MVATLLTTGVVIVALMALEWFLPQYQRPDNLFGVTVAPDTRQRPEGRALIARWRAVTAIIGVVALGAAIASGLLLPLYDAVLAHTGIIVGLAVAELVQLVAFHRQALAFGVPAPGAVRVAPLRGQPTGRLVPLWWEGLPLAIIAATAVILILAYPTAPAIIPIHWDVNDVANGFATKSIGSFFLPVWLQLVLYVLLSALTRMFRLGRVGSAAGAGSMAWRQAQARLLFLIKTAVILMMGSIAVVTTLSSVQGNAPSLLLLGGPLVMIIVILGAVSFVYVRSGQSGWRTAADGTSAPGDGTPDANWIGGIIYYNRNDPALLVERRMGMGMTLNMAHPLSWVILLATVALPVGIIILTHGVWH